MRFVLEEVLAVACDALGIVIFGARGSIRAHAAVRARALFQSPAHRVLGPSACAGLHLTELVAVRVRFTRDPVQEMIGLTRCAARVAILRTRGAVHTCASFACAFFDIAALRISSVGRGLSLHLALTVTICPCKALATLPVVCARARNALFAAVLGTARASGGNAIWTYALKIPTAHRIGSV